MGAIQFEFFFGKAVTAFPIPKAKTVDVGVLQSHPKMEFKKSAAVLSLFNHLPKASYSLTVSVRHQVSMGSLLHFQGEVSPILPLFVFV